MLILGAVILVILVVVVILLSRGGGRRRATHQYTAKPLLTANEKEFFTRLDEAVPEYLIQSQVAMGALMNGRHAEGKDFATRSTFDRKIVDFVLLDEKLDVVLIIELDDRTHKSDKDAARDAMTRQAGYATLRFESRAKPPVPELRTQILRAISQARRK
jgi:very-short-patch-repair endonuclease